VNFELATWHSKIDIVFQERDGVLLGVGSAIGNGVDEALYLLSFQSVTIVK
jgi:hypothetical protein